MLTVASRATAAFVAIGGGRPGGGDYIFKLVKASQYFFSKFNPPLVIVKFSIVAE